MIMAWTFTRDCKPYHQYCTYRHDNWFFNQNDKYLFISVATKSWPNYFPHNIITSIKFKRIQNYSNNQTESYYLLRLFLLALSYSIEHHWMFHIPNVVNILYMGSNQSMSTQDSFPVTRHTNQWRHSCSKYSSTILYSH